MEKKLGIFFGQVVRRHREKQGISQEDFADLAGIHRTYVSSIERGKVAVSIDVAQKLAVALGVPMSTLWREVERELEVATGSDGNPEKPSA